MGKKMDAMAARNQESEAMIRNVNVGNSTIATANTSHTSCHNKNQPQDQQTVVKDA